MANRKIISARKTGKIGCAVNILEVVPVRDEVDPRADLPHPCRSLPVNQDKGFIVADLGCEADKRAEERRVAGPDRGAETGYPVNGACQDDIFFHVRVLVMGKVVPADHVGEGVVAVYLRVLRVLFFEKCPVRKGHGPEIFLLQHGESSW